MKPIMVSLLFLSVWRKKQLSLAFYVQYALGSIDWKWATFFPTQKAQPCNTHRPRLKRSTADVPPAPEYTHCINTTVFPGLP